MPEDLWALALFFLDFPCVISDKDDGSDADADVE